MATKTMERTNAEQTGSRHWRPEDLPIPALNESPRMKTFQAKINKLQRVVDLIDSRLSENPLDDKSIADRIVEAEITKADDLDGILSSVQGPIERERLRSARKSLQSRIESLQTDASHSGLDFCYSRTHLEAGAELLDIQQSIARKQIEILKALKATFDEQLSLHRAVGELGYEPSRLRLPNLLLRHVGYDESMAGESRIEKAIAALERFGAGSREDHLQGRTHQV